MPASCWRCATSRGASSGVATWSSSPMPAPSKARTPCRTPSSAANRCASRPSNSGWRSTPCTSRHRRASRITPAPNGSTRPSPTTPCPGARSTMGSIRDRSRPSEPWWIPWRRPSCSRSRAPRRASSCPGAHVRPRSAGRPPKAEDAAARIESDARLIGRAMQLAYLGRVQGVTAPDLFRPGSATRTSPTLPSGPPRCAPC